MTLQQDFTKKKSLVSRNITRLLKSLVFPIHYTSDRTLVNTIQSTKMQSSGIQNSSHLMVCVCVCFTQNA